MRRITQSTLPAIVGDPHIFPKHWWLALNPTSELLACASECCLESYCGSDGKALCAAIAALLRGKGAKQVGTLCGCDHVKVSLVTGFGRRHARVRFICFGDVPCGVTPTQCCYARNPLPPALGCDAPPDPRQMDDEMRDEILERLAPMPMPTACLMSLFHTLTCTHSLPSAPIMYVCRLSEIQAPPPRVLLIRSLSKCILSTLRQSFSAESALTLLTQAGYIYTHNTTG